MYIITVSHGKRSGLNYVMENGHNGTTIIEIKRYEKHGDRKFYYEDIKLQNDKYYRIRYIRTDT